MQKLLDSVRAIIDRATAEVSKLVTVHVVTGMAGQLATAPARGVAAEPARRPHRKKAATAAALRGKKYRAKLAELAAKKLAAAERPPKVRAEGTKKLPRVLPPSKPGQKISYKGANKKTMIEAISDRRARVLEFLQKQPEPVRSGVVADALGLSGVLVKVDMAYLGSENKVRASGVGAGTRYRALVPQ